jgi:hypothetical protein
MKQTILDAAFAVFIGLVLTPFALHYFDVLFY